MNTRQGILVTTLCASLFMNFASIYWTMWAVLSTSLFALVVTDFMFFEVRRSLPHSSRPTQRSAALPPFCRIDAAAARRLIRRADHAMRRLRSCATSQDNEFWP